MSASNDAFLDQFLAYLLARTDDLISAPLTQEFEHLGLSNPEWRILAVLFDGVARSVGELTEFVFLPQPTVSRWVARLDAKSLVGRTEPEGDRRRSVVHLTADGRRVASRAIDAAKSRNDEVLAMFTHSQATDFQRLLRTLMDALVASTVANVPTVG